MALWFILGGSGAGKTHYLYNRIIEESIKKPEKKFFVIVPEQFTMAAQKDFVTLHPQKGIMNIDILSFLRLARRALEETDRKERQILEDIGKTMLLRKVMENKKEELCYFKGNLKKPGLVDEMKSLLSELFLYRVGEEQLHRLTACARKKPGLERKLRDVEVIYKGFQEYIEENYITAEGILEALCGVLEDAPLLSGSVVCLDGFTGFTPTQYQLLELILRKAEDVYVTITIDEREELSHLGEEFRLFHLSKKTLHRLYRMAEENGCEVMEPVYPKAKDGRLYRFLEAPALAALEKNLFRPYAESFTEKQENIRIRRLENPRAEVRLTVQKIFHLLREKGLRYRDIAVVTGDLEGYGPLLEEEYKKSGIPYFMDSKREILKNPYCRLLSGLMELFSQSFHYEGMLHCLRSGMLPFEEAQVDRLENYVLAVGICGYQQWKAPFHKVYGGLSEEELAELNKTREALMELLTPLWEVVSKRNRTVKEYTEALYRFGLTIGAYERLLAYQHSFEAQGKLLEAKEYGQVYQLVCEIFEQAVELLGEERVSLREYRELLETGLSKAEVGLIPAGIDQVMVGDMERTRLKDVKALFFLGVNDGMVPKVAKGGGILSDMERELLKESQVELAPTRRESLYQEQFYLYLSLTKAEKYLYLTYAATGTDGKERKPSYLIGKIGRMFPDAFAEEKDAVEERLGADRGLSYLLSHLYPAGRGELSPEEEHFFAGLLSWYLKEEGWQEAMASYIEGAVAPVAESRISQAAAAALYGEEHKGSVSRLEQYAACAFAHFIRYGLRLRERQSFRLLAPDLGNIFHEALERFALRLKEEGLSWEEVGEEQRKELAELCVDEAATEYGNQIFQSSSRNAYMLTRIKRILKRTLEILTKQLELGSFVPKGYEVTFRDDFYGRIDRLDLYETENEIYVKIMDYKSGSRAFDLVDLSYGLQLQLVVYLKAAMEQVEKNYPDKQVVPAGIFYYNLEDPIVDRDLPERVEQAILKELRMSGLVNGEEKILPLLDSHFSGEDGLSPSVKSQIIPVETLKDGSFSKASSVATTEDFEQLLAYTEKKLLRLSEEISEGNTSIHPYKLGKRCACDYCAYAAVCGFDKKREGYAYRKLREKSKEEVWREIYGEV